ncbi:M56 family metallopeptidase [Blastopirellula marina]|uniref:Peptidase M56 domain-containing protein n=1 Tax=Blastopirellula marina TaxID=124 RepID=A0A2S8GQ89_9BACT|nr:M56 family metallopeptidase [Blastopirellula marina]PQO46593.1 hypothetical protein C5Y93_08990 [Blastopirellula marina]
MWSFLQSPLAMKLTFVLLHFGWQALLLFCVWRIASTLMPQKSATARYNGALATLGLMLLCPVLTFLALDTWSLPQQQQTAYTSSETTLPVDERLASSEMADEPGQLDASMPGTTSSDSLDEHSVSTSSPNSTTSLLLIYQPYLMLLWLGGVMLLGLRICVSYLGTVWLRNVGLTQVDVDVLVLFSQIARQLNLVHLPPIAFSNRISQAMTVGLMRPMVLLPVAWMTEISPDVLEAVLAHELAHVRRSDLWINFLQRVAETVFFYHPAVWLLSAEIRRHRESSCDELAVAVTGQRLDYARSLQEIAHWQLAHGSPSLAAGFLGQRRGDLLARVRHILGATPPQAGERSWPAGLILAIVPLLLWAGSAIFFPQISPQALAEETTQETPIEEEKDLPVVPPHFHPPHSHGFPPHRHPMRIPPRSDNDGFAPRAGDPPPINVMPPNDQPFRRAIRAMRLELRDLREEVERLKQEQEIHPSAGRRSPPRRHGGWPVDDPIGGPVNDEASD